MPLQESSFAKKKIPDKRMHEVISVVCCRVTVVKPYRVVEEGRQVWGATTEWSRLYAFGYKLKATN